MGRSGGPAAAQPRRPGRAKGKSGRPWLILVACWAVPGMAFWSYVAFVPPSPDDELGWAYSVPSWVSLIAYLAAVVLLLSWVILPVLLLTAGFDYVRRARGLRWRWRGAWIGAAGAGIVLEALMVPLFDPVTVTPDWRAFAESLGFIAAGTVMVFVLSAAARPSAADLSGPATSPARP
jgi:hypothetical protein